MPVSFDFIFQATSTILYTGIVSKIITLNIILILIVKCIRR